MSCLSRSLLVLPAGLAVDGDPHFVVDFPLSKLTVCFNIDGQPGDILRLVSDHADSGTFCDLWARVMKVGLPSSVLETDGHEDKGVHHRHSLRTVSASLKEVDRGAWSQEDKHRKPCSDLSLVTRRPWYLLCQAPRYCKGQIP